MQMNYCLYILENLKLRGCLKKMKNNIIIDKMSIDDLDSIKSVLQDEFDDFWNYNVFKEELKNENSYYIIAKLEDNIVGFGGIWKAVDDVHITNIVVKKNFRKLGIGNVILEHLIKIGRNIKNMKSITLEVNDKNLPAINLYLKSGFKKVGLRKNYYGLDENAIIMTLDLNNK